jgi:hypothetical protein
MTALIIAVGAICCASTASPPWPWLVMATGGGLRRRPSGATANLTDAAVIGSND